MTDDCRPLLGPGRYEHERRVKSWHTPGCALLDRDVPCSCGGCPDHNTGQPYLATPEGYAQMLRRERIIGRVYVEDKAREVRRRWWPAPPGPAGWHWKDPIEKEDARRADRMRMMLQAELRYGFMVMTPTVASAIRVVTP